MSIVVKYDRSQELAIGPITAASASASVIIILAWFIIFIGFVGIGFESQGDDDDLREVCCKYFIDIEESYSRFIYHKVIILALTFGAVGLQIVAFIVAQQTLVSQGE